MHCGSLQHPAEDSRGHAGASPGLLQTPGLAQACRGLLIPILVTGLGLGGGGGAEQSQAEVARDPGFLRAV